MGVVALALVADGTGRYLFGRRRDDHRFTLPGGHAEPGETPEEALRRELAEETGLVPTSVSRLHVEPATPEHPELHLYTCAAAGTPVTHRDPDQEVSRWEWVDARDGLPKNVYDDLHGPEDETNLVRRVFDLRKHVDREWLAAGFAALNKTDDHPTHPHTLADVLAAGNFAGEGGHGELQGAVAMLSAGHDDPRFRLDPAYPLHQVQSEMPLHPVKLAGAREEFARTKSVRPIVLAHDGVLFDGAHRLAAQREAGRVTGPAYVMEPPREGLAKAETTVDPPPRSEIQALLRHPDPRERALALKLKGVTRRDLATGLLDPDDRVYRAALAHLDAPVSVLAAAPRDAAGRQHGRWLEVLSDPRATAADARAAMDAVLQDRAAPDATRATWACAIAQHPKYFYPTLAKSWAIQELALNQAPGEPSTDAGLERVPPALVPLATMYRDYVLYGAAEPVRVDGAEFAVPGTTVKVAYHTPVGRLLVKPYRAGSGYDGWAEITYGAMARAVGVPCSEAIAVPHGAGPAVAIRVVDAEHPEHTPLGDVHTDEFRAGLARVLVLDYLAAQTDRWPDNMLVYQGQPYPIDQAACFRYDDPGLVHYASPDFARYRRGWDQPSCVAADPDPAWWSRVRQPVAEAFADRLRVVRDPALVQVLRDGFGVRLRALDDLLPYTG